jgi:hypothetical protein
MKFFFSIRGILITAALFAGMTMLINLSPLGTRQLEEITGGVNILDMEFGGYSPDTAYQTLEAMGQAGRSFAMEKIWVLDCFFPLSYALFFWSLLGTMANGFCTILKKPPRRPYLFVLLPAVFGTIFDYAENLTMRRIFRAFPQHLDDTVRTASTFTRLKAAGMTIFFISALILLFLDIFAYFRKKTVS